MWKRVHLAAIEGPDPGHTIELGASGRSIPAGPWVVVGRGILADCQISDPSMSRRHFRARSGRTWWGRNGVWVEHQGRLRHLSLGRRWRSGSTLFEVRTDGPTPRIAARDFTRIVPVFVSLGFILMWIVPGAGPWPMVLSLLAAPAAMGFASRKRRHQLPDPAALRRNPTLTIDADDGWVVDIGRKPRSWRRKRMLLRTHEVIGFAGEHADGMARWVAAQLSVYGGAITPLEAGEGEGFRVEFDPEESLDITWTLHPDALPGHVTHTCPTTPGHHRNVTSHWFDTFIASNAPPRLPERVLLRDYLPHRETLSEAWANHDGRLRAPIAVESGSHGLRPLEIDLGGDTPHAVIAGTTGAGKSVLLTSWLLSLASHYPPSYMAFILVDYKGGATFQALHELPHVLGVLTDLEHEHTVRALESLSAEIHRRERLFKQVGVAGLSEYNARNPEPLARLVVVVDEFRVLADEFPDILDRLVRVAAQGRSLGIHVILATQRPGGAMTPDIRTNMGIRISLKVIEEADSLDLLGVTDAAELPTIPGRLIVRTDELHTAQALWAEDDVDDVVRATLNASGHHSHLQPPSPPWAPALPSPLTSMPPPDGANIPIGIADLPDQQRLAPWYLPPQANLVISGDSGAGLTNTARIVAAGLLTTQRPVHVIAHSALTPPGAGSFAPPSDPATCISVLTRIQQGRTKGGVIIDDLQSLNDSLDDVLGPGEGVGLIQQALRASRQAGAFTAVTVGLPPPSWLRGTHTLVFLPDDPHRGLLAGINKDLNHPGPQGRAVLLHNAQQVLLQVPHVPTPPLPEHLPPAEFTITPLPSRVNLPAPTGARIDIGIGGDDHRRIHLPCEPGKITLIVGSSGAGKTHAMRIIQARARVSGQDQHLSVVDDAHTSASEALDECWQAIQHGHHGVLTITPEGLASGFHPLIQRAKHAEHILYLGQMPRTVLGVNINRYVSPNIVGRGVLVSQGKYLPVQLDCGEELISFISARETRPHHPVPGP